MDALFFALGSHGDVHPMAGLATSLRDRGHRVAIATSPYYQGLLEQAGVPLIPLGTVDELLEAMRDPDLWHPQKAFDLITERMMLRFMRPIYEVIAARYVPGETVVIAPPTALGARIAQEKLGVPLATVHLSPAAIQSTYVAPVLPPMLTQPWVPRWLKQLQYWMVNRLIIDRKLAEPINQFRRELGLATPVDGIFREWWNSSERVLCLFPEWFGPRQPDWPPQVVFTGFPLWDERSVTPMPPEAEAFLVAGDSPIVFTPGSAMLHGRDFFEAAIGACQKLNRRGILLTRHREQIPGTIPASIQHFDFVPLGQLLPRCAAIVHHGGVGTIAQGLAAGIPHVTMPMAHDQHDNAARLVRLGVSKTIERKQFHAETLAEALHVLVDQPRIRQRCAQLASTIHPAEALAASCNEIEKLVHRPTTSH